MGRLQKVQNQTQVSIFEALLNEHVPVKDRQPEMKKESARTAERQARAEANREEWEVRSESPKLRHSNPAEVDLARRGNSIRSARCASTGITNERGSGRYVGSSKNQTPVSALDAAIEKMTKREATAEEKRASSELRSMRQAEYRSAQSPRLGEADESILTGKAANITSNHAQQSSRYAAGAGKISIFDNSDFERIPERKMEVRQAKTDDSWKQPKKAFSSKDATNRLVDGLGSQNNSEHKSLHKDATDRLFDAIVNNLNNKG